MGCERTNSSRQTVERGQLRWEGEMWKCDVSICGTWYNEFDDSWGEGQGTIAVGRGKNQYAYFQGYQHGRVPTGSLKWHRWKVRRHKTRHFKGVLTRDVRGPLDVMKELIGRSLKALLKVASCFVVVTSDISVFHRMGFSCET